jgi:polynucleotide 5'-kinase involved in rRNA processing
VHECISNNIVHTPPTRTDALSFSSPSTMWKSIRKHFKLTKKPFTEEEVPDKNRRFRVLILGPANAGKTTLLERLTDSPAGASIVTRNGTRVITTDVGAQ